LKRLLVFAFAALAACGAHAQQNFPSRPITLIVGFAAGGATDTAARIIARKLSENLGQSVIVDNRAGAGGNIAHQQIATATPDGHPGIPAKTLQEFVALAKAKPGKLEYGSTGVGSAGNLAGELLKQRAGIDLTHVPYKGGGAAMPDILGGRIASYWSLPSTVLPHIHTGKLRPLAVTGLARAPTLPDVPTVAESGYPGYIRRESDTWGRVIKAANIKAD